MRRMITEKDVEKLDSIKPSEIEKLGKITDADIENVKATQSPIGATANYVLTADGKGKATYKPAGGQSYTATAMETTVRLTVYPSGEQSSFGAAFSVIIPKETGRKILAVINPNFYNGVYNNQQLDVSRICVESSGGNGFTVRIPKSISNALGMTDGSNITISCAPLVAYIEA